MQGSKGSKRRCAEDPFTLWPIQVPVLGSDGGGYTRVPDVPSKKSQFPEFSKLMTCQDDVSERVVRVATKFKKVGLCSYDWSAEIAK